MQALSAILSIETSTQLGSVCLIARGNTYFHDFESAHLQAAELIPTIENLLHEANLSYSELTDLCACVGPGSFTGIRIGLSAARMIAFSQRSLRLHAFTSLEAMAAASVLAGEKVLPLLRAGKGQIYTQDVAAQAKPELLNPEQITCQPSTRMIGNCLELLPHLQIEDCAPSARTMASAILAGYSPPARTLSPLYIRPPDAKVASGSRL